MSLDSPDPEDKTCDRMLGTLCLALGLSLMPLDNPFKFPSTALLYVHFTPASSMSDI